MLTHFILIFCFELSPPEKPNAFLCFQGGQKEPLVRNGLRKPVSCKTLLFAYLKRFTLIVADIKRINFSNDTPTMKDFLLMC